MTTVCSGALDLLLSTSDVSVVVRPIAHYECSVRPVTSDEVTKPTEKQMEIALQIKKCRCKYQATVQENKES